MAMASEVAIPRLIMQTWKTHELPDKWKATQISINKYMPSWKYVLMTDEMNRQFISQHFPSFLQHFDDFPYPIQRADAIRYAWLYINGGLYFDCDFELLGPLDELFTEDHDLFLLASSNTTNVITNGFMASKPRNTLWLDMIEEMKKPPGIFYLERHLHVMYTTGPGAFNRLVKRSNIKFKQLPSSKINPYTLCETIYNKPNTLMRPLEGSSWVGQAAALYQWCYCNTQYILIFTIVTTLIFALICMTRYHIITV